MRPNYFLLILLFVLADATFSQATPSRAIDTDAINQFFNSHKIYSAYRKDVEELYHNHPAYFWYTNNYISEFGVLMYKAACKIGEEGLPEEIPYRKELDKVFKDSGKIIPTKQNDILLTCLYYYYTDKVFNGLSIENSLETGWKLPRQRENYISWLASPEVVKEILIAGKPLFDQYYQLKAALLKYRKIAANGGWETITIEEKETVKLNDVSNTAAAVRQRLFTEDYLASDSHSNLFDNELLGAITSYQEHHGIIPNPVINEALIASLNVPATLRIESIAVNMERCRWINPEPEMNYIAVNIPSFRLFYFENNEPVFTSKVVVGKEMNKTVVFSGMLNQVIFNPYWNVPKSILNKEILPALRKNSRYLKQHRMEWHNGTVRQKPGDDNALGRVKFMFPNSNNIYLHDTPQKKLFNEEKRAFSHGCIRVEKACELAGLLMFKNYGWSELQTIDAMQQNTQKVYLLKNPVPVYIVYFTAWADTSGYVSFYPDVYNRDKKLAALLFNEIAEK